MHTSIKHNRDAHNALAEKYEDRHGEIFSSQEQTRLRDALARAIDCVETGTDQTLALDYGCGTGNLTRHLLDLDCDVIAADVSERFLALIDKRYGEIGHIKTHLLNGKRLNEFLKQTNVKLYGQMNI